MPFPAPERALLLAVRGVGPGVVSRLEQIGIHSLPALAGRDAGAICAEVSALLGTTCWRNAPKARQAVEAAIAAAREAARA
jgi:hypothetical protein